MKEVIVYLIDYKSYGNGYYDNVLIDFMKKEHYLTYLERTHEAETTGSLLEMRNIRSEKRLIRGAYYALNVDLLSGLKREFFEDTLVFAGYYDFNSLNTITSPGFFNNHQLFLPHSPLPEDRTFISNDKIELSANEFYLDDNNKHIMMLVVNDVGQANWNEIHVNNRVIIVYDIGAPLRAKREEVKNYINDYYNKYKNSNPLLIISHWDLDHYHCLLQMTDDQIKLFSGVVCVNKVKSLISEKVLWRLIDVLGRKRVTCIGPPPRKYKPFPYPHRFTKIGCLSVYICERSRNINYSGVIISVDSGSCNVICTGDSTLSQACIVLENNMSSHERSIMMNDHILVVPHHGGYYSNSNYAFYILPKGISGKEAIISVGRNNYGHPDYRTINILASAPFSRITKTNTLGVIKRYF